MQAIPRKGEGLNPMRIWPLNGSGAWVRTKDLAVRVYDHILTPSQVTSGSVHHGHPTDRSHPFLPDFLSLNWQIEF